MNPVFLLYNTLKSYMASDKTRRSAPLVCKYLAASLRYTSRGSARTVYCVSTLRQLKPNLAVTIEVRLVFAPEKRIHL